MRTIGSGMLAAVLFGLLAAGPAPAQESLLASIMRSHNAHVRFIVVDGRIRLDWTQPIQFGTNSNSGKTRETLQVVNRNGQVSLSFERSAPDESLTVLGDGEGVSVVRSPRGKSAIVPLEFRQNPRENTLFSLGAGPEKRTFAADDLWQLLIVRRKECDEHLLPLLEMLRPDWKIAETRESVLEKLLHGSGQDVVEQRARWSALVEQLGDERFAKREAADRALRNEGAAAIGYLRKLDHNRLDAEQRFRIRRILDAFVGEAEDDAAEDVAARLAGDPLVWLALLDRPEPESRKTAARQLEQLLGEPIGVDPMADPETQKEQRERLRDRMRQP